MFNLPNGKVAAAQVLWPLSLVAFVVFLSSAFEFSQVEQVRSTLHQAMAQQDKPLEDYQKVQTQVNALAIGTENLAEKGDSNAKAIIERMAKLGISVKMPPSTASNGGSNGIVPASASAPASGAMNNDGEEGADSSNAAPAPAAMERMPTKPKTMGTSR